MLSDILKSKRRSKSVNTLPILLKSPPKVESSGFPFERRPIEVDPPIYKCSNPPRISLRDHELVHIHCTSWSNYITNFIVVMKSNEPESRVVKVDGKEVLVTRATMKLALSKDEFRKKFGFIPHFDSELDSLLERIRQRNKDRQNVSYSETSE